MKPHIEIVASGPGMGHFTRSAAIRDALMDLGATAAIVEQPTPGVPRVYDTPEHPLVGKPLRRAFWNRCVMGLGGGDMSALTEMLRPTGMEVKILSGLSAQGVREAMEWADVAIVNGGQTFNEAQAMGLPCIVVITADDQWPNVFGCDTIAVTCTDDGNMTHIVAEAILPWVDEGHWLAIDMLGHVRESTRDDWDRLMELANDCRQVSFTKRKITAKEHAEYMRTHQVWVAEVCGQWAGYVRFDDGEVSIALIPELRGKGFGRWVLSSAIREAGVDEVKAWAMLDNMPSRRMFESMGFIEKERTPDAILYTLHHARHQA